MRISTAQIYSAGVESIARQQDALLHTQQQVAAGKRLLVPSDDPLAAAQSLTVQQAKDKITQYAANNDTAKDALGLNDSVLSQVTDLLQSVRTLAINAGSPGLNDSDRASLATDAQSQLDHLIGLANTQDGDGRFLFAGFASDRQPFVNAAGGGVTYNGDQGTREIEVAPGRSLPLGASGSAVFEQIRNGNGSFAATASGANTGTGTISAGTVVNPALLPGDTYRLQFNVAGPVTTYDVIDVTTATTVSSGNAYTSGSAITVAGMQVAVSGAPANGDAFTLAPSTSQSVFTTVQNLINTLRTPAPPGPATTALQNGLTASLSDLDQALDHVLTVRAGFGASLRELDALATGNADRSTQYDQTISRLTDLDYNQALSDFARQQLSLEAAQKSFLKITSLSLFNFL
jgi:flagellar hook-associated protein 3 FlgL